MNIGKRIKEARKKAGLTQKQLAEKLGVTQAAIVQFESEKSNPKIETIEKIANALDIHPLILLDRISYDFANEIATNLTPGETFASLFNNIYGGLKLEKNASDNIDHIELNYILGNDNNLTISDLTYDNITESIERLVRISVDFAIKYNSQEPFSFLFDLEKADLLIWKKVHEYANFLIDKQRE